MTLYYEAHMSPTGDTPGMLSILARLREPWMRDGLCAEYPEVDFYPARGASAEPAKALCRRCLVREECLGYALAERITSGIWGGTSERERKRLRSVAHGRQEAA